jgi:glycosyltransferase involved in cell wall biosynthesis
MRISVITVARNAAATIGEAVASVARQRHPEIEHIVIDGASTDDTVAIARRSSDRIACIVSEPDSGIYDAMNRGLALATGDIVGLLNADDLYAHDDVLTRVAAAMGAHPEADGCYADIVYVDRAAPGRVVRHWRSCAYRRGLFARGWVPPHPTVYLRRTAYALIGGFDLRYRLAADFELLLRAFEVHRLRTLYVPEVWVRMRLGGATNQSAGNIANGNREIADALRRHHVGWPPFTLACRLLRRVPQYLAKHP